MNDELSTYGGPTGWGPEGPSLFDLAMAATIDLVEKLDERRRRKFIEGLRRWFRKPPPATARVATERTPTLDRYVGAITMTGWNAVHRHVSDRDDRQELFQCGVVAGLNRVFKYWGPGRRYPHRNPVPYSLQAIKSACFNEVRKSRGSDD